MYENNVFDRGHPVRRLDPVWSDAATAKKANQDTFGPVFADDDLPYGGVQIPKRFWKTAAWTMDGKPASAGFLLDQSPLLDKADLKKAIRERLLADEPPPLGPTPGRSDSELCVSVGRRARALQPAPRHGG